MNDALPIDPAEAALCKAVKILGSRAELARRLNISRPAVAQWRVVPIRRAGEVARITGLPLGAVKNKVVEEHRAAEVEGFLQLVAECDVVPPPVQAVGQRIEVGDTVETNFLGKLIRAVVTEKDPMNRLRILGDFMGEAREFVVDLPKVVRIVSDVTGDQAKKGAA